MLTTSIVALSYAAAAAAYFFLSGLLLTSWRGRLHGMVLTAACLLSALWRRRSPIRPLWDARYRS